MKNECQTHGLESPVGDSRQNKLRFELGSTQAEAGRLQFYKKFNDLTQKNEDDLISTHFLTDHTMVHTHGCLCMITVRYF